MRIVRFSFIFILIVSFFNPQAIKAQDKIDTIQSTFNKALSLKEAAPDSAILYLQSGLSLLENSSSGNLEHLQLLKIDYLTELGRIFHQQSKYDFAGTYFQQALDAAQKTENDSVKGECYFSIAELSLENGSYVTAIESYSKALELWKKINFVDGIFWAHIGLGIIYRETGNTKRSQFHYEQARQLGYDYNIESYIGITNNNLGNLFRQVGNYKQAIDYLQQALDSFKKMQNELYESDCLSSIGTVYIDYGDAQRAIEYYKHATALAEKLEDKYRLLGLYGNMGNTYSLLDEKDQALMYFSKTLELAQAVGDNARLGEVYLVISEFYKKYNDFDNALANLKKSLKISEEIGDSVSVASALTAVSDLYCKNGRINQALPQALRAYHIAQRINLLKVVEQSASCLVQIYAAKKNYKQAYIYSGLATAAKDSLLNAEKIKILEEIQAKYDLERIESEKLASENEKLLAEQKLTNQRYLTSLLIIILMVFIFIAGRYLLKRQKEKKEEQEQAINLAQKIDLLNSELNEKNRELTSKVMMIAQNNQTITNISEAIEAYLKSGDDKELRKLQNHLRDTVEESSWNDFLKHFQEVHPQFYHNLAEQFPELSSGEQKICAFLRMNLNSKEIAQITGQSVKSVEVARSRIRKKLNIGHDENLSIAILKI